MPKLKHFLLSLLALPLLTLFSCGEQMSNPCNVVKQNGDEVEHLHVDYESGGFKTVYNDGEEIQIDKIEVTYGTPTPILLTFDNSKDYTKADSYFITTNQDYPTNAIVTNLRITTNVEESKLTFYIAHYDNLNDTIYVYPGKEITIKNVNAIKPWVWFVVSGVVIFGVVAMVVFTKRHKEKSQK